MARTLIRDATCVLPHETVKTSVLIDGGKIASVDAPRTSSAHRVVEARGLVLMPGVIDDQVHFRDPGLTHKEDLHTGSLACAKGGVTTFLEMPNTKPTTTTVERLREKLDRAAGSSVVSYGFYIGATPDNVAELRRAERTPGIKIFIGSSTGELLVDDQEALERIFEETRLPICAHCEDETTVRRNQVELAETRDVAAHSRIRTREAAILATRRAVDLSFRHRHPFHVLHVTTKEEVDLLRDHRNLVTAEACIHHLWFHTGDYERLGSRIQTNPSVKEKADNDALWKGLRSGALQVVATDHAPHTLEEKAQPYPRSPSGLPAVENSLALMMHAVSEGRCTLRQVAAWMCEAPARVWNIVNKGWIEEGFDADLVLVDPELRHTIRDEDQVTRCGWSPWHGVELTGGPVMTWSLGRLVHDRGRLEAGIRGREAVFDHGRGGYWRTG